MTQSKYIYSAVALVGAAFLAAATPASAIQLQWSQTYSGIDSGGGWLRRPAIDSAGNVYTAYTIHVGGMGTNYDVVISKYDSAGVLQWQQTLDGDFHGHDADAGIAIDSTDSVIVAVNSETAANTYEILLLKFDAAGNLSPTWQDNGDGDGVRSVVSGGNSSAGALLLDGNDTIFIGGSSGAGDATLFKVNANGIMSRSWMDAGDGYGVRRIAGRQLWFPQIGLDDLGNVVIGGTTVTGTSGTEDVFVAKYTPSGTQAWTPKTYTYNTTSSDWMIGFKVDGDGNIYSAGSSSASIGAVQYMLTVKWLANGTRDWVRRYNNDPGSSMSSAKAIGVDVDASGNVYVGGRAPSATRGAFGNTDIAIWRLKGATGALDTTAWPGTGVNAGMRRYFGSQTDVGVGVREVRVSSNSQSLYFTGGIRINAPINYSEAFTGKIQNSSGTTQWTETFTSPGAIGSYGLGISLSTLSPGFFYVQGYTGGAGTSSEMPTLFRYNY